MLALGRMRAHRSTHRSGCVISIVPRNRRNLRITSCSAYEVTSACGAPSSRPGSPHHFSDPLNRRGIPLEKSIVKEVRYKIAKINGTLKHANRPLGSDSEGDVGT